MILLFTYSTVFLTNLSPNAANQKVTGQLFDLLSCAADLSPVDVVSSISPDRLKVAIGPQRFQPGHPGSLSIDSSGLMPTQWCPYLQDLKPSVSGIGDVSDINVEMSTIVTDLRRTLRHMVHQAQ